MKAGKEHSSRELAQHNTQRAKLSRRVAGCPNVALQYAVVEEAMYGALVRAATQVPPDIRIALEQALATETSDLSREHLRAALENMRLAESGHGLVCADTGFPLFYVAAGDQVQIEGGLQSLWRAAESAVHRATDKGFLRPTMVDPISRANPGDNVGGGMPHVDLAIRSGDELEIVAVPKGGGSEIFGTFYHMFFPSDGQEGIYDFVMDCIVAGCYAGKICPPAIVGVGIGGTADLCMLTAKRQAVLRPVGRVNEDPRLAEMESALLEASHHLGVGPMGAAGRNAVLAVHIGTMFTHTAGLPVAVNAQCMVGRRWIARVQLSGEVEYTGDIR